MKKFQYLLFAFAAVTMSLVATSCGEDDTVIVVNDPPAMILLSTDPTGVNGDYQTTSFETDKVGEFVYFGLEAAKGTGTLQSLLVNENGAKLGTDRLSFRDLSDGSDIPANNSLLITGTNVDGFAIEVGVKLQEDLSTSTYTFELTDENGETAILTIDVTTFDPTTPLDKTLMGTLLNQAGPAGQGALDLDDGIGTGATTGDFEIAEIRDMGIDNGPVATNWRQQIGIINGTEMRVPGTTALENFDFDLVDNKEAIIALYDASDNLPNEVDGIPATNALLEGDILVVRRPSDDRYYLLRIASINATADDNGDNYVIDIKY